VVTAQALAWIAHHARQREGARGARRPSSSEVDETLLRDPLVGSRDRAAVLLEGVKEDDEVAGALVQNPVSGLENRQSARPPVSMMPTPG
jgi:hypothetical protein